MAGQQTPRGAHDGLYHQLITTYNVVLIVGLVLNILVVSVAYVSRRVQRCRSWYIFMMSWIILSLSFLFLLGQQTGPKPAFEICLAQAVLIYAAPPLTAFSTLILVVNLYFGLSGGCARARFLLWLSMLLPPAVYLSIIAEATVIGITNPSEVRRDRTGMYCHIKLATPAIVTFAVIGLSVIFMVGFMVATVLVVRRKSTSFVGQKVPASVVPLGIIVRVGVFTIAPISVLILEALIMLKSQSIVAMSVTAIMYAVLPLLAALTFGTQADILHAMNAHPHTTQSNTEPKDTGSDLSQPQLIWVFNALLSAGALQLIVIFLTALLSKRVRRVVTWYMFIFAWIIHSLSFLFIAGRQVGSPPTIGVCLIGSALIYASPPLTGFATLILVLQLFLNVSFGRSMEKRKQIEGYFHIALMLPPMMFTLVVAGVIALASQEPKCITRDQSGMICHLDDPGSVIVIWNTVILTLCVSLVLLAGGSTIRILWRRRKAMRDMYDFDPITKGLVFRLALFNIGPCMVLIYEVVLIPFSDNGIKVTFCHIAYASLPNLAAWTFGSQSDIMRVWMFWKRDNTDNTSTKPEGFL
ncbi:hypothetical protein EYR40_007571 [Pleurotus pulmonarius]|nr:hypothetical protein EYR40_007571 [Pleurotus pulmonarius]